MSNKLTDEQIAELAPDWATHYSCMLAGIVYLSECHWQVYTEGVYSDIHNRKAISKDAKPIPRKKFDIREYEFSDSIAEFEVEVCDTLVLKSHGSWFSFDKDDAIAIAKHFNLTADDLK